MHLERTYSLLSTREGIDDRAPSRDEEGDGGRHFNRVFFECVVKVLKIIMMKSSFHTFKISDIVWCIHEEASIWEASNPNRRRQERDEVIQVIKDCETAGRTAT